MGYQIVSSHEEMELNEGNILPGMEERLSFKTLLFPDNPTPSKLSGFTVNVCVFLLGMLLNQDCLKMAIKSYKQCKKIKYKDLVKHFSFKCAVEITFICLLNKMKALDLW